MLNSSVAAPCHASPSGKGDNALYVLPPFGPCLGTTSWTADTSLSFEWFDRPGESSPEKDCCW